MWWDIVTLDKLSGPKSNVKHPENKSSYISTPAINYIGFCSDACGIQRKLWIFGTNSISPGLKYVFVDRDRNFRCKHMEVYQGGDFCICVVYIGSNTETEYIRCNNDEAQLSTFSSKLLLYFCTKNVVKNSWKWCDTTDWTTTVR